MWSVEFDWVDECGDRHSRTMNDIDIQNMDALREEAEKVSAFMDWTLVEVYFWGNK